MVETIDVVVEKQTLGPDVVTDTTNANITALITQLNAYYQVQSGGKVSIVLNPVIEHRTLKLPTCSTQNAMNDVDSSGAAGPFGGFYAHTRGIGTHRHLLILTTDCKVASVGQLGGNGGTLVVNDGAAGPYSLGSLVHEFGHNLGLNHAGAANCGQNLDGTSAQVSMNPGAACPADQYGDSLDPMGATYPVSPPGISSPQRIAAGWMVDYAKVTPGTSATQFHLNPLSSAGTVGIRAVKVTADNGDVYYIEYRSKTGQDATAGQWTDPIAPAVGEVRIVRFHDGTEMTSVMEVGPANPASPGHRGAFLPVGSTFASAGNDGFTLTVNATTANGADIVLADDPVVATTTALAVNPVSIGRGGSATATATVTATGGVKPVGTVTFRDGATILGVVPVDANGIATFHLPTTLAAGQHVLTASFAPVAGQDQDPSASANEVIVVNDAAAVGLPLPLVAG